GQKLIAGAMDLAAGGTGTRLDPDAAVGRRPAWLVLNLLRAIHGHQPDAAIYPRAGRKSGFFLDSRLRTTARIGLGAGVRSDAELNVGLRRRPLLLDAAVAGRVEGRAFI